MKVIAAEIGKSHQTVYREISRHSKPGGRYQPWWAHNQALRNRQRARPPKITPGGPLHAAIIGKLDRRWSPQQIARFLRRTYLGQPEMQVCAETIYRAMFAGVLGKRQERLRTGRACRRRKRRGAAEPNKIKNMRLLARRPLQVLDRAQPGHWEGDLIIGAKMTAAIGTLVERTSRYLILVHLPGGYKAPQLRDALISQAALIPPGLRKTLTWDQGREMAMHEQTEAATGWEVFFCDPHSPWQRPTNENTNGLIRQYFPKHTDLRVHTARDLQHVATELNQRPRLVLGDQTPEEAMRRLITTCDTS